MRSLKIALFTYSTKPRGSVIHTLELAQALHILGHQVCIYALSKDGYGFDYPLSCRYQLILAGVAPPDIDQLIKQRIAEFIDFFQDSPLNYDIYHAQDCISANALAQLKEQQKIPHFIRTVHHIEDYQSIYLQQCQERSILQADLCLCVSSQWQKVLQETYHIKADRVFNGVNRELFSPVSNGGEKLLQERLGLHGHPIYLTVGGIEPRKNSLTLLKAFKLVLKNYSKAQLVIAGGATLFDYQAYREEFFSLAKELEIVIGESLILPGVIAQADLPSLYRIADIFVFPSVKEGWGLVLLEAMASGLPVITSNLPPFTEFLSRQDALLVDVHSASSIAEAMISLLQPDLSSALIERGKYLITSYTWEISATIHSKIYERISSYTSKLDM